MISEGSCDTEDWNKGCKKNQLCVTLINYIWKYIRIDNSCFKMLFYCIKKTTDTDFVSMILIFKNICMVVIFGKIYLINFILEYIIYLQCVYYIFMSLFSALFLS